VSLEAVVLDSNNRPITTLKREDFTIHEDSQPQVIQSFSSVESPYNILLLFQNTPSINVHRPFMTSASNSFLGALRPQDRVSIYTIEFTMRRIMDWRNARIGEEQNVKIGVSSGVLNLYDRVNDAFGKFGGVTGRKGIIVLSSGRDQWFFEETLQRGAVPTASEDKAFQKLVQQVRDRRIPLYFVAINTDRNLMVDADDRSLLGTSDEYVYLKQWYPRAAKAGFAKTKDRSPTIADDFLREVRSRMELLAEVSGGRIYFPARLDDVVPLYTQIARELGTSYSFGYAPRQLAPGPHRIQIQVSKPGLRVVQSRESYTARYDRELVTESN
jgi:VWFA-related protein